MARDVKSTLRGTCELVGDLIPAVMLVVGSARANDVAYLLRYQREGAAFSCNLLANQSDVGVSLQGTLERDVAGSTPHQPHEVIVLPGGQSIRMKV